MTWAWPERLLWLVALLPLTGLLVWALRRRARDLHRLVAAGVFASLVSPGVGTIRVVQAACITLGVALSLLAVAGPRLGFDWQQRKSQGVSIVAVLDVSRSMDAADESPSRLDRARRELEDLAGLLRGDAIGLVIFAAGAYARIPLTVDLDTFVWAVRDSSAETITAQGTSLASAIQLGTGMLSAAEGTGKAMIIVSDGEGHDKDPVLDEAVQAAVAAGVRIYTLGIGTPDGAPIPLGSGGGFKKDNQGNVVVTRLNESALSDLAAATGGAYVRAVPSLDDVRALYEGEIRTKLEASERGMLRDKVWREYYQIPLGLALLLFCFQSALGVRWRRVGTGAALLLAVGLLTPGLAWAGAREDGLGAYRNQKWQEAIAPLAQAALERPADMEVARALAEALYREGHFREAEQAFGRLAASAQDQGAQAIDTFNAGNAAYRAGRLDDALLRYQEALKQNPELEPARKNAEAVAKEIELRKNPPPPEEGEGQPQNDKPPGQPRPGDEPPANPEGAPEPSTDTPREAQTAPESDEPGTPDVVPPPSDAGPPPGDATKAAAEAEPQDSGQSSTVDEPNERGMVRLTPDQASRLVDSVQEGKPRVRVSGQESEKDW